MTLENLKTAGWICILLGVWSYVQDAEYTERMQDQAAYTKALERTLATCLSGPDVPIQIGSEIWFCGAADTGVRGPI